MIHLESMDILTGLYSGYGLIALFISALAWAVSHLAFIKKYRNLDLSFRLIGFVAFILIFVLSGLKAGLIAIPVILGVSFLGAWLAARSS